MDVNAMKQGEPRFSLVCRAVVYQLCLMMALQPAHPAFAEGIAVATGSTTLNQAGNGVPIVDIATPNGAGLSHNLYQDFNVGQAGVILNNATGQLTQTQLGGLIQNNPHLNGQAADLIINEVVGANPSQLQGYLEVAGQQAGVVVANPNGLTCDGCGFINTPTVTLSTGKPVLDAQGQLQALDVKQGTLTVGGKGLDATRQTSVDLVARAVQLNGALHGQTVNVVAGANKVNRQTGEIVAQAGNGPAPEVAIDTAALGGMYAGKIRLVSTEQGVGVNLANVVAKQGALTLDASGKIRLADSRAAEALQVKGTHDLVLAGTVQAGQRGTLEAQGVLSARDATITAGERVRLSAGDVQLSQSKVVSNGKLEMKARDGLTLQGGSLQATAIDLGANELDNRSTLTAQAVTLQAGQLQQSGEIHASKVQLTGGQVSHKGSTLAEQRIDIQARQLTNQGVLKSGNALHIDLEERGRNEGTISSAGLLDVRANNGWEQAVQGTSEATTASLSAAEVNIGGKMTAAGTLSVEAETMVASGELRAGDVQLKAGSLDNRGEIQAGQALSWQGETLDNRGRLQGDSALLLKGRTISNAGSLAGGDTLTVQADTLTNGGHIASQDLKLDTHRLHSDGTLLGVSRLDIKGDELVLTGQQLTDGELQLGSRLLQLRGQTLVGKKAQVTADEGTFGGLLKAQSLVLNVEQATSEGKLHSREDVQWQGQRLATGQQSELLANHRVVLNGQQLTLGGNVGAGQGIDIKGKQIAQRGSLVSEQTLKIEASDLSLDGQVQGRSVQLGSEHGRQSGRLLAADSLTWQSQQLDAQGWLQAGNSLVLSGDSLRHTGTALTQGSMAVEFADLASDGGMFAREMRLKGKDLTLRGTLESSGAVRIEGDALALGGTLRSGGDVTLGARLLTLSGIQQVDGNLQLDAEQAQLLGALDVAGPLVINTRELHSRGKVLAGQAKIDAVQWTQEGSLATEGGLEWHGSDLVQQDSGSLQSGERLSLTGKEIHLAGSVNAKGDMAFTADHYQQTGAINTATALTGTADSLQLGGNTQADTATLHSRKGEVGGKHLINSELVWQSDELANRGWLQAGEGLTLTGKQLDNDGTLMAGGQNRVSVLDQLINRGNLAGNTLSLTAGTLQSSGLLQGKRGLDIKADNVTLTGRLTSQGAVRLGATLLALGGEGRIGGGLTLEGNEQQLSGAWRIGGVLASRASQLTSKGDWQASEWQQVADTLTNSGRMASEQDARFDVGEFDNRQGATLVVGGALALTGQRLVQEGRWLGTGDQQLKVDELKQRGQWASDGAVAIAGHTLHNSGNLRAATLSLKVNDLENRGRMESHSDVNWQGEQWDNLGSLLAGKAELSGRHIRNSGDTGARLLTMQASERLDNSGVLVGKEGISLTATVIDSQGDMLSGAALNLGADLLTLNGLTRAASTLDVKATRATLAGNMEADTLQWHGEHLVLSGTALARDTTLTGQSIALDGTLKGERQQLEATTLTTGEQSQLLAKVAQRLKADQMTLQGSAVAGQQQQLDANALTQQGVLASGDTLELHVAGTLRNDGNLSGQTLSLHAAHIDNGGALVSKGALSLNTGTLTNRGHWQSDQGITLTATRLLNSGQWVSGLAQQLTLDTLDNSGTLLSGGGLSVEASQLVNNSGQLTAKGDLALTAANVTLAEGSTTASNGRLVLAAPTLLSKGTLSAAGAFQWQGQQLNQSGTLVTDSLMSLQGTEMVLAGTVQGARLKIDTQNLTSAGTLSGRDEVVIHAGGSVQHDGQLRGGDLTLQSAAWRGRGAVSSGKDLSLQSGQLQLQGPWRIRGNTDIQADSITLDGSFISGGELVLASRAGITSQAGSQLVSGGALSLAGRTLSQQGRWQSGRAMTLKGERFAQQGELLASSDLMVQTNNWQHEGKTHTHGALTVALSESATFDGELQADGGIALTAPSLTLKGTLASNGNVSLSATALLTQLGNLLSGGELTLSAARIAQQGRVEVGSLQSRGELQNDGVLLVTGKGDISGSLLDNRGTLQGETLAITSAQLVNSGALLGNSLILANDGVTNSGRLQGTTLSLDTRSLNNAQGAVLRAQTSGNINATTLGNSGELSSGGHLQLTGNQLDNAGLISANWLAASPLAQLVNSGTLFGQQLTLNSAEIRAPGKILAAQKANIDAGRVTGIGEWLSGGDLALNVGSSLTSQGTLSAKGALDLQVQGDWLHQGQWGAGAGFNAAVTGALTSKGALVSNGAMQLNAQRLENSGSVQAGQGLGINTGGELRNSGMLAALGDMGWQGESLFNSGTVYSGGSQSLTANSNLTNEYGTMLAEKGAELRVNHGGLINSSGELDSNGELRLFADDVVNQRAKFSISYQGGVNNQPPQTKVVTPRESSGCGGAGDHERCSVRLNYPESVKDTISGRQVSVLDYSPSGEIKARDRLVIVSRNLKNSFSNIVSGSGIHIDSALLKNESLSEGVSELHLVYKPQDGFQTSRSFSQSNSMPSVPHQYLSATYVLSSVNETHVNAGRTFNSLISAGGNLTGTVAGMVDNVTIKAHAGPVSSTTQRPTISLPQAPGAGVAPGLQEDAQYLSQVLKSVGPDNGVPLPDFQLPNGDKGLFTVNGNSDSPYLIEVNPLLANLGEVGNGMMDRIDDALQQHLQGPGSLTFARAGSGDWLSQAAGQSDSWSLPERQTAEVESPTLQTLGAVNAVGDSSHGTTVQWQQSLQGHWQGQPIAAVAVTAPGTVQSSMQPVPALVTQPQIETSPTLTQVDKFLGSSYFFGQVNFVPEKDIKLLGDAAFDTRVIRDAVLAQTGRRFINGEMGSDLAQMRALIDSAAQNQRELGLTPGVTLSAAQVAQLGRSMVWWEPVWYQGKIVLAPKLYLTEADKRHLSGSVITAANIDLTAGGINNSGTLLADGTLSLKSGSTLVNQGQIQAGGRLELIAKGDILNQNLIKGGEVAMASLDGSVRNETLTAQRHVDVNGVLSDVLSEQTRFSRTDIGDIARIESAGNLLLQAGQDISLSASNLLAGLDMTLNAGRDITIGSLEDRRKWEEGNSRFARVEQLMSALEAGGSTSLNAGQDLTISASLVEGKGDISLLAGNNLSLASEANQTSDDVRQGSKHTIDRTTTQVGATVSGDNVSVSAGNNLLAQASTLEAQGNASLQAGGELQLLTADNEVYHFEKSKSGGTFKSKTTEIEQRDVTAQGTTITAGGNVSLASQGDMTLKGSDIKATDSLAIDTDGQLNLLTATDEHFYRKDEKKSGVMVKMSGNGTNSTAERQNQLDGADINISAGQGVLLQVGQKEGESLQARLDTLATQPGMAWVEQVRSMPGVKMEAVQEAYEQWNYSQQSLSPIASSIIAIALAVATGGAGALAMGAAEGTATAAMANAAFSTLVSQATISTINNGGNLGAVLKELGSSASVKQLATSVATAGALQGLDNAMGWASAAPAASNAASQPAASNLLSWDTFNRVTSHSVVTAGINTTINGSHFADAFKASLLSNIQGEVGKATANWIGDQGIKFDAANSPLAEAGKIAAHGVTSGAIAEITGGKFAAGAAGGAMSEIASSWSSQVFSNTEHQVALNKVLGGLAAVAVTGDQNQFDTGAERAETVERYNNHAHALAALKARYPEKYAKLMDAKQKEFKSCGESPECKNVAIAGFGLVGLPLLSSELLLAAGIGGSANTGFQLWDNKWDIRKVDAREAVFAAYLSAGTAGWGFWSTVGANGAGGAYMSYLKGEDPLNGGVSSGVGAGLGYGLGKLIEIPMDIKMNPNYKNYEWADIGLGITKQPAIDITPSTTGNILSSVPSEWTSKMVEEEIKNDFKK